MKPKFSLLFLLFLIAFRLPAQELAGQWTGALDIQGHALHIVFHIARSGTGYSATMDSPDQGVKGIPVSETRFENNKVMLALKAAGIEYNGELKGNAISGTFRQAGRDLPLELSRDAVAEPVPVRPQEPAKPYAYPTEEVSFASEESSAAPIQLSGTLSLPGEKGPFPAVILVSGSGPQNRDEELLGHKPFLVIADYLTRHGIAVLRYDDRGTGASGGDFKSATTADFAKDAASAFAWLKRHPQIDPKKIGIIGHSEGGAVAPIVAAQHSDLDFIVLLAGPGLSGDKLLLLQQQKIGKSSGRTDEQLAKLLKNNTEAFKIIRSTTDSQQLRKALTAMIGKSLDEDTSAKLPEGMTRGQFIDMQLRASTAPWMQYFLRYDPVPTLEKVHCPVLALNGERDLQVPPKENLGAIRQALDKGKNKRHKEVELPGLNHLFQECKTCTVDEYGTLEQTFSPKALEVMANWIAEEVR